MADDEADVSGLGALALSGGALGQLPPDQREMPPLLRAQLERGQKMFDTSEGALSKYEAGAATAFDGRRDAIKRGLDTLLAQKRDNTPLLLAMASGFLKPTKTGSFFESLGETGGAAIAPLTHERGLEEARRKQGLDYELAMAGVDSDQAKLGLSTALERAKLGRGLSSDALRLEGQRQLLASRAAGQQDLAKLRATLAQPKTEKAELSLSDEQAKQLNMPKGPGVFLVNKADGSVVRRLGDIVVKSDKAGELGAMSPFGKQAADEGYVPGTPEFNDRVKAIGKQTAPPNLTPGQRAVDAAFGKEYAELVGAGGLADALKNVTQLRGAIAQLKSGTQNLTGPVVGSPLNITRAYLNPASVDIEDRIGELVQRNLRVILGAQFTQEEGRQLIARSFNKQLDEKVNAKRLQRLLVSMEKALEAKQKAAAYFEQHGTLAGFKGQAAFSLGDFQSALDSPDAKPGKKDRVIVKPEDLD